MPNWIDLDGLANCRDLGGTPTVDGGPIRPGRLLRSDNLQTLTDADIDHLRRRGLTDVVDLRSRFEVAAEGPGPLAGAAGVRIHWRSLLPETGPEVGPHDTAEAQYVIEQDVIDQALPWIDLTPSVQVRNEVASMYLSYLADRPDSVVAALRDIAAADGAVLVHCAAGKDRTGTVVALALLLAGAEPDAVIADYAATSERIEAVLARLLASPTYHDNLVGRPLEAHLAQAATMAAFLAHVDEAYGGVGPMLAELGWTDADTAALRAKLRD